MNYMNEDEQLALALSLSLAAEGGGGGGAPRSFSSSSQDPRSGHKVGQASRVVCTTNVPLGDDGRANGVIQVREGDMTKEDVGAIVNAANKHLDHASGLAGAIVKNGGEIIQMESDIYIHEHGIVPEGEIAVTHAGSLVAKHVIHAVGPMWHGGVEGEVSLLRSCTWKSFKKADEMGLTSISVPAISSGIFGFPKDLCAKTLFDAAIDFYKTNPSSLHEIRFTNFDAKTVEVFSAEFKKRFGEGK
eukprot:TRINITY_DN6918_c0_g1_i1.p1 TRINITY_DN6918_c0_g1~~TRINITY_DN6918_c0_g1_i1.p1  ORF type:complete len:245 (+),score=45.79 TRINITY_DN6918_c0_g1_i1:143-877(+)